ncbi:DUF4197 domain-containing protein [Hippea alviniae]|uniref:DUF4197 domain-containing protein n=1 Tax=Hippea alviniae TaxID=1279027 RepID=UPI0003B43E81|nr:DUF4197 domain-containing protein [Hippea alviniae]
MRVAVIGVVIVLFLSFSANAGWMEEQLKNFGVVVEQQNQEKDFNLTNEDAVNSLKEALIVSVSDVIGKLGRLNGFYKDPKVHIPLPEKIKQLKDLLEMVGLEEDLNKLELQMNRAAEKATPKAKRIFIKAIREMSVQDAKGILKGPDDAATQYFKRKMTPELKDAFRPIVKRTLYKVGAIRTYDEMFEGISEFLPFTKSRGFNFIDYVLNKTIDGIFYYMAEEEKQIRKNPAKRTTELLKKVFGFYDK